MFITFNLTNVKALVFKNKLQFNTEFTKNANSAVDILIVLSGLKNVAGYVRYFLPPISYRF